MAKVFIPPQIRPLAGGCEIVDVSGRNVREVIDQLDSRFPGFKNRVCDGDSLRPGLVVAVGPSIQASGLRAAIEADSEVHFLPAIGGG
jgi:sulfur-carrier protein